MFHIMSYKCQLIRKGLSWGLCVFAKAIMLLVEFSNALKPCSRTESRSLTNRSYPLQSQA